MAKYLKIYSIDIALGALVNMWFLSRVARVNIEWPVYLVLFLAVWVIYTLDHLIDGLKIGEKKDAPSRYFYHKKFLVPIFIILGIAALTAITLTFLFIREELLITGLYISTGAIVYFLLRFFMKKFFSGLKELMAALIYTLGVALPSYTLLEGFDFFYGLVFLQLFCLVFANLLICAVWDEKWDRDNFYDSMVVFFGKPIIAIFMMALIAITVFSSAAGFFIYEGIFLKYQFVILLMGTALLLFYYFADSWGENTQRIAIDSIFFIPLLIYFI